MKYSKLLLSLALGIGIFSSCQKDSDNILVAPQSTQTSTNALNSEQDALNLIASGLLKASQKDNLFAPSLSRLSQEKFDGDFDYLAVKLYDGSELRSSEQGVSSLMRESLIEVIGENAGKIIKEIAQKYPLINIYTPFEENDFLSAKDFLIVVDNISGKDGEGYLLSAYNKKGELVRLSSSEEPTIPYIVVGRNERVEVAKNNSIRALKSAETTYHKNETHSFILKNGFSNILNEENKLRSSLLDDDIDWSDFDIDFGTYRSPEDKDSYDYISQAEFMSKSALQRVESWSRGQPEVVLTIYYDSVGSKNPETQIYSDKYKLNIDLGENGWYSGSRSWLKPGKFTVRTNTTGWYITRWNIVANPTQMRYYFVEEDGNFDLKLSYKGLAIEVNLSGAADFIGETIVDYKDSLPREYPIGNTFKFTLDLRFK